MPARFADIKFNLMRAIELFEDMNHLDMDVTAPPSSNNFFKEIEVAQRLNIFLGQLIDEGIFDDCELRENGSSEEEIDGRSLDESSTPRSSGFSYNGQVEPIANSSEGEDRGSRESFTDRFKRYIRRIIPVNKKRSDTQAQNKHDVHHHHDNMVNQPETSSSSYEDEDYIDEDIYDPSSNSFSSGSVHDGHTIHEHHRDGTVNSTSSGRSRSRDTIAEEADHVDSDNSYLDDEPLPSRSRSTSRGSSIASRRSSQSSVSGRGSSISRTASRPSSSGSSTRSRRRSRTRRGQRRGQSGKTRSRSRARTGRVRSSNRL